VPSQTFTNRSFFHAASSSGLLHNSPYSSWLKTNTAETIFNRIDAVRRAGLEWHVYWDRSDAIPLTALIHFPTLQGRLERFRDMQGFYADARQGRLPAYSFIEPRFIFNHNDAHPPFVELGSRAAWPSSALGAEVLLNNIYTAIRGARSRNGSNWQNTLLLITFDEAGGTFDHVPPQAAPPPDPAAPAGEMGFTFNRAGVRVPTIAVSAWTEPGTVINQPFEHTALIQTLARQWDLGNLTRRDQAAPDLSPVFNRTTPRPVEEWPVLTPRPYSARSASNVGAKLNGLQWAITRLGNTLFDDLAAFDRDRATVGDAVRDLRRAGRRLGL
jgi:phospholipase C